MPFSWIVALVATVAADDRLPSGDLGRLQGAWEASSGPGQGAPIVLTVRGTACEIRATDPDGGTVTTTAELTLDEAANPPSWDATRRRAADGRLMPDLKGIYRIEGEGPDAVLRLGHNGPGKPRPAAFTPIIDGLPVVTVFRRAPSPAAARSPNPVLRP